MYDVLVIHNFKDKRKIYTFCSEKNIKPGTTYKQDNIFINVLQCYKKTDSVERKMIKTNSITDNEFDNHKVIKSLLLEGSITVSDHIAKIYKNNTRGNSHYSNEQIKKRIIRNCILGSVVINKNKLIIFKYGHTHFFLNLKKMRIEKVIFRQKLESKFYVNKNKKRKLNLILEIEE